MPRTSFKMSLETTNLEAETRKEIDLTFIVAGWVVQDKKCINLHDGEHCVNE